MPPAPPIAPSADVPPGDRAPAGGPAAWRILAQPDMLGLAVAAAALSIACVLLARLPGNVAALWLANAVAVAVLVRWPARRVPAGMAAFLAGVLAANLLTESGPVAALGLAVANTLEVAIALVLVRRIGNGDLSEPRRVIATIVVAGFVAPAITAPLGAAIFAWAAGGEPAAVPMQRIATIWWVGSAMGATIILPAALTFSRRAFERWRRYAALLDFLAHLALSVAVTVLALDHLTFPFIVIALPLILAAIRLDALQTAMLAAVTVATVIVRLHLTGIGIDGTGFPVEQHIAAALTTLPPFAVAVLKDELLSSEARFHRALDESAIGMALIGLDGRWLRINPAAATMLGHVPQSLVGRAFRDVVHPDDARREPDFMPRILDGTQPSYRAERRLLHRDGRPVWAMLAVSAVRDETTGEPRCFIAQIEDIDERKRAEQRLTESENRWQFALESAGQGVWDRDVPAGTTYYSPTWKSMLGYAVDEIGSDSQAWQALLHPHDRPRVLELERQCREGDTDLFEAEFRMLHKDGHWVWINDRGRVLARDGDGHALRAIGTHTDITQRKQAEDAFQTLADRTQLAVQAAGVGIWEMDVQTGLMTWDQRMHELYGTPPGTFGATRAAWARCLHPDDLSRVGREFKQALAGPEPFDSEFRIIRNDGAVRHMRILGRVLRDRADQPIRVIGTHWDVTEQRRLTDALFEEKERLRITLYSIGDAVICTDAEMRITFMNPIAEQLTGWAMSEADRRPLDEVFHVVDEHTGETIASPVEECLSHMRPYYLQDGAVLVSRGGDRMNVQDSAAPVRTASGEIIGAVLVFQDITRAHELQKQLTHSALHDALTGLPNRAAFELALQETRRAMAGSDRHSTLCFLDLDRFKIVNDSAGHAAGDALLRLIGRTIRAMVRPGDVTARLGGDEFGILLRDCPVDEAETIAARVIEAVKTVRFPWEGRVYDVGASIGMTGISDRSPAYEELLKEADVACYAAKAGGRNRVAVYAAGEGDVDRYHRDIRVASGIRAAIEANRFRLYAQEICDLRRPHAGRRHFEILLRLVDEHGELTSPAAFIPAAERYDLMGSIDRWVICALLRDHRQALRDAPDIALAINLSANSLSDPLLWPFVLEEMRAAGIAADRLHFEITETAIINNFAIASQFVTAVRAAGARVVLDDFGSGLSSFAYLKQFEVDYLKIDGGFVRNLQTSVVDRRIVESINDVGHALGITTVAECVEDEATLQAVRRMGIDMAQGYYLGEPEPIETLFAEPLAGAGGTPVG